MNIKLQAAAEPDMDEVWAMFVPAMKPHVDRIWGWELDWQTSEFHRRFLELNTSFLSVNRKKVGYVQYSLDQETTYLNMLILNPECQGKQMGARVLNQIQALQVNKPLRLRCFHINERALSFYQKNGFKIIEREEKFLLMQRDRLLN